MAVAVIVRLVRGGMDHRRGVRDGNVVMRPGRVTGVIVGRFGAGMASAGAERPDHGFVIDELVEHITTHLQALDRLGQHGYTFGDRQLVVLASAEQSEVGDRVAQRMERVAPTSRAPLEQPYYDGLRFMVYVRHSSGANVPLIDGGRFEWLGTLAANRKLAFVASAVGSQVAAYAFRAGGPQGR